MRARTCLFLGLAAVLFGDCRLSAGSRASRAASGQGLVRCTSPLEHRPPAIITHTSGLLPALLTSIEALGSGLPAIGPTGATPTRPTAFNHTTGPTSTRAITDLRIRMRRSTRTQIISPTSTSSTCTLAKPNAQRRRPTGTKPHSPVRDLHTPQAMPRLSPRVTWC